MRWSLADRSRFYDDFGKLLTAGFPFSKALETMLSTQPRGSTGRILRRLREKSQANATITESISEPGLPFSVMEKALLGACEKSGQLQRGCEFLSRYYARLHVVRRQVTGRLVYPLFLLHFGVIVLSLPQFFRGVSPLSVLVEIGWQLGAFYALVIAAIFLVGMLRDIARHSSLLDELLNAIPLLGGIRRSLSLSRFCITYQMQLDSGVNVMDSLISASGASGSAKIQGGVLRILPGVRSGLPVGPALVGTKCLPADLVSRMIVGEQTGALDAELLRAADDYEASAVRGIEAAGDWTPKIVYLVIALILAWNIISTARGTMDQINGVIDGF